MYLYSVSSLSASNALPLPIHLRWSLPQSYSQASANTARPRKRPGVWHDMPVYSPQLSPGRPTHSSLPAEGGFRLSRPGCLLLHRGGLPIQRWSPSQAPTGPSV